MGSALLQLIKRKIKKNICKLHMRLQSVYNVSLENICRFSNITFPSVMKSVMAAVTLAEEGSVHENCKYVNITAGKFKRCIF